MLPISELQIWKILSDKTAEMDISVDLFIQFNRSFFKNNFLYINKK